MTTYEIAACPACRGKNHQMIASREEVRHELEMLWQFHLRRLRTGAPLNQLFDRAIFSQQPPLHIVECGSCGTVFRNPRELERDVVRTYEEETPAVDALESLFRQQYEFYTPRVQRLTTMSGRTGSVLEVGSYIGGFLSAARDAGWEAVGLDVNAQATEFARRRGCTVEQVALHDFKPDRRFDVVALWNCLDQMPDPHEALAAANALLNPGGMLAIRVPNGAFYARLRGVPSGLRRALMAWNNLASFPYRHGFTLEALRHMLDEQGFEMVASQADVLVSISGSWTRNWARWEERILKRASKLLLRRSLAPWLEGYFRAKRRH